MLISEKFDVIVIGTGFAGAFFLWRYLQHAGPKVKVLVLERGNADPKSWQLQHRATSSIGLDEVYHNATPSKPWLTSPGLGGNSKCWWAGAMRMMPNDFKLRSRYGVGDDWPISYDDLEEHYSTVEEVMQVSGPSDFPLPRSRPYPLPPHRFSDPDILLKRHFPDSWFHPPTARASVATATRGACCASGICDLCPVDAKFTIQNGMPELFHDSRVTLRMQATAATITTSAGIASGVTYLHNGQTREVKADLIVLAASALFNPHILLRSNISHRLLGKRLSDQYEMNVCVDLKGVNAYNGSTVITGNGYMFYDGEHRRDHAACLVETWNSPFTYQDASFRSERGRWRERQYFRFIFDELPMEKNSVVIHAANPRLAETRHYGYSDYALRAAARIPSMIDKLAEALPIERVVEINEVITSAHIQGTAVMGSDPEHSVVDPYLVHHQFRNLLVLGASAFPTAIPGLPTLTVSALSIRAADRLFDKRVTA